MAAFSSGVPPAIRSMSARSIPSSSGRTNHSSVRPSATSITRVSLGDADLVDAVGGADDQGALAAQPDERLGDRLLVAAVGDAEQLPRGARPGW